MSDTLNALLINREWCTGCQSCEIACRNEHGWDLAKYGIKVEELGPTEMEPGVITWDYLPTMTQYCDMCEDRVAAGGIPSCALHCLAQVIFYGDAKELAEMAVREGMKRAILMVSEQVSK